MILLVHLDLSLILYCHFSVYFVTRRHHKPLKTLQRERKALKITRIASMALLVCFLPVIVHYLILDVSFKSSSDVGNIMSHPFVISVMLLNSLCSPVNTALDISRFERHARSC